MSDLSKFLRNWKPQFNFNIRFPFGRKEAKSCHVKEKGAAGADANKKKETIIMKPWYKSKGKIGAILAGVAFIIENSLPAFGVEFPIPGWIFGLLEGFGISLSAYGIRAALPK